MNFKSTIGLQSLSAIIDLGGPMVGPLVVCANGPVVKFPLAWAYFESCFSAFRYGAIG